MGSYKRHKCPQCEYSTDITTCLRNHIRTHTGERPYVCSYGECQKRFTTKYNLDRHIKRHLGIKNHKCSHCNKTFVTKHDLTKHIRTHTGEKPFECKHCKQRFTTSTNLSRHIKSMHK